MIQSLLAHRGARFPAEAETAGGRRRRRAGASKAADPALPCLSLFPSFPYFKIYSFGGKETHCCAWITVQSDAWETHPIGGRKKQSAPPPHPPTDKRRGRPHSATLACPTASIVIVWDVWRVRRGGGESGGRRKEELQLCPLFCLPPYPRTRTLSLSLCVREDPS